MADEQHADEETSNKYVGKSVLDHFSQISNDNEAKRVKNASLLLQFLYKSSNDQNIDEVQYALKRIVRGLGGSKNSTRVGFYSTFVALLHTFTFLALDEVLKCIRKELQVEGANSKSEIGDIYTGQVLACGALIHSRKIFTGNREQQENVLRLLINAGKNRSYLSMASVKFIADLLAMCDEEQLKQLWPVLSPEILKPWPEQGLDSLYLLLLVCKSFPGFLKGSTLNKVLCSHEVLCDKNLEAICNVALNILTVSSLKHFLYPLLGEAIASSNMDLLFVTELDQHLARYNRNKLMAASLLIRNVVEHVQDSTKIPEFLPENFVRQILYHYRNNRTNNKDEEFHEEMTNFFDGLCKCLQRGAVEAKTKINVLKKIIFYPGSFMFENVTKSKNVQKLVRTLDKDGVKKLSALYRDVLIMKKDKTVAPNVTEQWLNSERIYSAQLLTKLLSFPLVQSETQWKIKNLKLFMDIGVFKSKYGNVGIELAHNVKDVFFRALDLKFNKLEDVAMVLYELSEYLNSALPEHVDYLRSPLTEEELEIFNKMYLLATKLNAKKDKDECALVFQVLFLHMGLQLFQDKDLAVSSLNELFSCYERVSRKRKEVSEGDPEWIEVVVDLFLNLLSHNSLLLRNIVGSVFPYLCKYLTPSSMHQILTVLDPNNDSNPLSANDSESESDAEDSDQEESDDENETVNDKLRLAVQVALGNNGYQTDEESIDLDDMDENDAEKLDTALANAFRQFKPNRGKIKKQSKQEETLTHFRIRVLDLLEIYLDSEPGMLSCLEMMLPLLQVLEFSIKDDHQKPLLMRVRHCLRKLSNVKKFNSVEGITDATLGDLLNSLLEKGTKNSILLQDMSNEISECCVFIIKCTQSDSFQGKTKKRCQEQVIGILTDAINVYFKQRDCLIPYYLFKSIFQLHWDGNLTFAPLLFDFVFNKDIRPFRRNQALDLLKIFYSNRRVDEAYDKFLSTVAKHEKTLCDNVIEMFEEFCQRPKTKQIKEKFVSNLFNLLKAMLSHSRRNESVDLKVLGDKIREFRSHVPLSRDAKVTYNQLCRILQIPHAVKMKPDVVKFNNKEESDEEHVAKKGKMTETKKERKEAKARRVQNMSEGLSEFSFTNLKEEDLTTQVNGLAHDEEYPSKKLLKRRKSEDLVQRSTKKTSLNKSANV